MERKKEELKSLRSFEPLDYKTLQKHTKKYLVEKKLKEHELSRERSKMLSQTCEKAKNDISRIQRLNHTKSPPAMMMYEKEILLNEERERKKEEERKKIQERVHSYSRYVKEMYLPHISKEKQEELDKEYHKKAKNFQSQRGSQANLLKIANGGGSGSHSTLTPSLKVSKSNHKLKRPPTLSSHLVSNYETLLTPQTSSSVEQSGKKKKVIVDWRKFENKMLPTTTTPGANMAAQPSQFHDSTLDYLS